MDAVSDRIRLLHQLLAIFHEKIYAPKYSFVDFGSKFGISLSKLGAFLKECDGNDELKQKLVPLIELLNAILIQEYDRGVAHPSITSCFRADSDQRQPSIVFSSAIQGFLTLLKPDNCEAARQVHFNNLCS